MMYYRRLLRSWLKVNWPHIKNIFNDVLTFFVFGGLILGLILGWLGAVGVILLWWLRY